MAKHLIKLFIVHNEKLHFDIVKGLSQMQNGLLMYG